ncbi:MAG TPA: tetratricopeptide repeat protein, partial [Candidatus Eisenbacteria bacterium]|nr:tetratricopeptide repeat protein [Candidatus Eisenbacteria bacterium]
DFSDKPEVEAALQDPDLFRRTAQQYLGEFFTSTSKTNPVVLHIEDIHWADDRSLDLINNLVRENTELPLFVLCMARPSLYERRPQWGEGQRFHERIQLDPLSQLSSRRLVRELLKNVPEVPTALRDLVVDRADGNPFYIEELIKALIDDRIILKGEEAWSVDTSRLSTVRVPATLTGVLQARLDTLPAPLHQLLQRASVVGRIFWDAAAVRLSQEAAGLTADEVQAMLEDLRDREMILQREESGFAGTVEYVFRHAILRDVTYETVVPRQRRAFHKMVGDWLLEVGGERAGEHTLLVAEHYSRAEEAAMASAQLRKAGEKAMLLAAYEEAATVFQRAREILTGAEHVAPRLEVELLRAELETRRGIHATAVEILKPALEEARAIGHEILQANFLGQLGRIAYWRRDIAASEKYLKEALSIARKSGDKPTLIFTLRQIGNLNYRTDTDLSRKSLEESIQLAREIMDRRSEATALNSLGNLLAYLDDYPRAIECYEPAGAIFREIGDRTSECMVMGNLAFLHLELGDTAAAEREGKTALAITRETGAIQLRSGAEFVLANICLRSGRNVEAWRYVDMAVATTKEVGEPLLYAPFCYGVLKIRRDGDRGTGLAWIGFSRAHEKEYQKELAADIKRVWQEIRGDLTDEAVEAAMKLGETLKLDDITAQAAAEGPEGK